MFRVPGFVLRVSVKVSGRVSGLEFWVQGFVFRVSCTVSGRVSGFGFRVPASHLGGYPRGS